MVFFMIASVSHLFTEEVLTSAVIAAAWTSHGGGIAETIIAMITEVFDPILTKIYQNLNANEMMIFFYYHFIAALHTIECKDDWKGHGRSSSAASSCLLVAIAFVNTFQL